MTLGRIVTNIWRWMRVGSSLSQFCTYRCPVRVYCEVTLTLENWRRVARRAVQKFEQAYKLSAMGTTVQVLVLQIVAVLLWTASHSHVEAQGSWATVVKNAGIATMHSAVTNYGTVVLLDRTNIGPSQLALPAGVCRNNPADRVTLPWAILVDVYHSCLLRNWWKLKLSSTP